MKIKTKTKYHLAPVRMAIINKTKNNKCCRGCGKRGTLVPCGGNANWCSFYGKNSATVGSRNLSSKYLNILNTLSCRDISAPMFLAALFTIAKAGKQPKCPLTNDSIKRRYMYTMGYYSVIKISTVLPFTTTQMALESIMLSERSQMKKDTTHMTSFICGV